MRFSEGLDGDFVGKGGITFATLAARRSSEYVSKPEGILSQDEDQDDFDDDWDEDFDDETPDEGITPGDEEP